MFSSAGTGSGTLDAAPFGDAAFEVVITADTDDAYVAQTGNYALNDLSGTISIDGVGGGAFDELLCVYNNPNEAQLGFGNSTQADPIAVHGSDPGYDLTTSTVIVDAEPGYAQFKDVVLEVGLLTISDIPDVTVEAEGTPEVPPRLLSPAALLVTALLASRRRWAAARASIL